MTHFLRDLLAALLFATVFTVADAQTETASTDITATPEVATVPKYGAVYQMEIKDQAVAEGFRGMKVEKRFARRLPNFYSQVVSDTQRDKIYKIQEAYFGPVEMLTLRLERLKTEREAQIEAVLTADQKARIDALAKESASRRTATRAASASAN